MVDSACAPLCASARSGPPTAAEDVDASATVPAPGAFRFLEVEEALEGRSVLEVSSIAGVMGVSGKAVADGGWR